MQVYITNANAKRILQKIDRKKIPISGEELYDKKIVFFNNREKQDLLLLKRIFETGGEVFLDESLKKIEPRKDDLKLVFVGKNPPAYHYKSDCKRLVSNFKNYEVPEEIRVKGKEVVEIYRNWFEQNQYLILEGKMDELVAKINSMFGVNIRFVKEYNLDNSGTREIPSYNLEETKAKINELLEKARNCYFEDDFHTEVLNKLSRHSYLGERDESSISEESPMAKDYKELTGKYGKEKVRALLSMYDSEFKKPLQELLKHYYLLRFNPNLSFSKGFLDMLGFVACNQCS